jgi:FeS assembly SUF system protein
MFRWLSGAGAREADDAGEPASGQARRDQILDALKTVYDPEIPVNILDLGLIYDIDLDERGDVHIRMTLTAPACPVAGTMPGNVSRAVEAVPGVGEVSVELVWDPPWSADRMSDEARVALGIYE